MFLTCSLHRSLKSKNTLNATLLEPPSPFSARVKRLQQRFSFPTNTRALVPSEALVYLVQVVQKNDNNFLTSVKSICETATARPCSVIRACASVSFSPHPTLPFDRFVLQWKTFDCLILQPLWLAIGSCLVIIILRERVLCWWGASNGVLVGKLDTPRLPSCTARFNATFTAHYAHAATLWKRWSANAIEKGTCVSLRVYTLLIATLASPNSCRVFVLHA